MSGWIQLHRSLIDWEWYDDANTMRLFLHCCLRANFEDAKWRGMDIKRGTFITSINSLSKELKLSESKIKLSIKKLKTTNEITIKTTNKNTTVTICNYDTYNNLKKQNNKPDNNQPDNQTTNKQQSNDKQTATDKKNNNNKQEKQELNKQLESSWEIFWNDYPKKTNNVRKGIRSNEDEGCNERNRSASIVCGANCWARLHGLYMGVFYVS